MYQLLCLAENRAALRELEGINKLINFIGHPEWSDLHVFAVMVISNCLEDTESMEVNNICLKMCEFILLNSIRYAINIHSHVLFEFRRHEDLIPYM